MMRLFVGAFALAALAAPGTAEAFHPFEETYGYQMPKKWQKQPKAAKAAKPGASQPLFSFGSSKKKTKSAKVQQQDYDQPAKKSLAKGPAELDGGPRPNISPVAPQTVSFPNGYGSGSIVIDTAGRKLYYVLSSSQAYKYPISVGREGFTWTGTQKISKEVNWPDWRPPAEMLERKPELPELMTGGIRNPLGAKALYLGNTLYRIHGTNDTKSIGYAASSGCFRMMNGHVVHLAGIAGIGTTVHVLNKLPSNIAKAAKNGGDG